MPELFVPFEGVEVVQLVGGNLTGGPSALTANDDDSSFVQFGPSPWVEEEGGGFTDARSDIFTFTLAAAVDLPTGATDITTDIYGTAKSETGGLLGGYLVDDYDAFVWHSSYPEGEAVQGIAAGSDLNNAGSFPTSYVDREFSWSEPNVVDEATLRAGGRRFWLAKGVGIEAEWRRITRLGVLVTYTLTVEPILRVHPRSDGRGLSSARRVWPSSKASQDNRWLPYGGGYR